MEPHTPVGSLIDFTREYRVLSSTLGFESCGQGCFLVQCSVFWKIKNEWKWQHAGLCLKFGSKGTLPLSNLVMKKGLRKALQLLASS